MTRPTPPTCRRPGHAAPAAEVRGDGATLRQRGRAPPVGAHPGRARLPAARPVRAQRGRRARPRGRHRPAPRHPRHVRARHPGRPDPHVDRRVRRASSSRSRSPTSPTAASGPGIAAAGGGVVGRVLRRSRGLAPTVWLFGGRPRPAPARAGPSTGATHQSLLADYYPVDARPGVFARPRRGQLVGQFIGAARRRLLALLVRVAVAVHPLRRPDAHPRALRAAAEGAGARLPRAVRSCDRRGDGAHRGEAGVDGRGVAHPLADPHAAPHLHRDAVPARSRRSRSARCCSCSTQEELGLNTAQRGLLAATDRALPVRRAVRRRAPRRQLLRKDPALIAPVPGHRRRRAAGGRRCSSW